jgi:hypothetical protein
MSTTIDDLKEWFKDGKRQHATHMIVVDDAFEHEDYPVYVMPGMDVNEKLKDYTDANMQRVMEVYSLKKKFEDQKTNGHFVWDTE